MSEQAETAPAAAQEDQKTAEVAPEENKDVKENGTGEAEPVAEQEKEAPKEMRAVILTGFGGLKSVKILKKPEPTVNEGEVLIRVKACGLNFQDLMVRQGAIDSPPKCPFILGFECAGEIEQVGEGVECFAVGDQVVALPEYRAWAELVAVPSKYAFKLPKDVSHLDAATITMNYTVAYILLFELAGLSKGKSILVHSVGGGVDFVTSVSHTCPVLFDHFKIETDIVFDENSTLSSNQERPSSRGSPSSAIVKEPSNRDVEVGTSGSNGQAVVQLAKTVPDVTIVGICSKGKHESLKNANSPIDHLLERGSDYSSEVRKVLPDGVDIVLDCLCGEECNKGYNLLKPMGKYILYGSSNVVTGETKSFFSAARSWWQVDKVSPLKLFDENRTLCGFNLRRLMFQQGGHEFVAKAVQEVFSLFQGKKIQPLLDSTWALEDVAEAMQKMHDRKNVGKIILDPSLEPKPKPATPAKGKSKEDKKKQSSEEKKEPEEKKEEEKKEEKKDEQLTNGDSAGDSDSKGKENSS